MRVEYNIVGGFSFYERQEVKDIIAYLKLALNPADDIALLRVINTPTRGIGKTTLDELQARSKDLGVSLWETIGIITDSGSGVKANLTNRAKEAVRSFKKVIDGLQRKTSELEGSEKKVSDVVIAAIDDSGYSMMLRSENSDESEARLENLEELVNASVDYDRMEEATLRDFIDHAALTSDTDSIDSNARVTMMTIHAAKGLEFPIVFLVGLEDGIFPHSRSINDPAELEEERRLAYVAITRAEKILYISHSMRRRVYGEEIAAEPSQFLNEMPLELIEDLSYGASWLSFARGSTVTANRQAAAALRGERVIEKPKNPYAGKTYNSAEAVAEFFKKKDITPLSRGGGESISSGSEKTIDFTERTIEYDEPVKNKPLSGLEKLRAAGSQKPQNASSVPGGFIAGAHVRHEKYGKGLVLRREGSGDNVKLTISFPGFGQKKMIEKFANLQKA
jgi:DNA helicase II / ATP-dependent DNA helicase PcrA